MNGFTTVPLEQPGLLRRMLGRKVKDNALREIENLLAERSAADLTAGDVETILSNYELPRPETDQGLADFYRTAVDYRAKDLHLTEVREQEQLIEYLDSRLEQLRGLQQVLGEQVDTLIAYRKSLIHECVTGQQRVTAADVQRVMMAAG